MTFKPSAPEAAFAQIVRMLYIKEPETQHRFHPERKWRFDFAWPDEKFAVEIEGVTYQGGRHQRMQGFMNDAEKYEAGMLLGWTIYRVPAPWVWKGKRIQNRAKLFEMLRMNVPSLC